MKHTITSKSSPEEQPSNPRFEGYLLGARLSILLGLLPTCFYWLAFKQFGSSNLPWQISFGIEIFTPTAIYAHYYLNRNSRRLTWEGVAVCIQFLPMWLLFGSHWIFYFGFAPMLTSIREIALALGFGATAFWTIITWRAFERETMRQGLIGRLYEEGETCINFSSESDTKFLESNLTFVGQCLDEMQTFIRRPQAGSPHAPGYAPTSG